MSFVVHSRLRTLCWLGRRATWRAFSTTASVSSTGGADASAASHSVNESAEDADDDGADSQRSATHERALKKQREAFDSWLALRRGEVAERVKGSMAPLVTERTKKQMFALHSQAPEKWPVAAVAKRFGLPVDRTRAILVLQGIEEAQLKAGCLVETEQPVYESILEQKAGIHEELVQDPKALIQKGSLKYQEGREAVEEGEIEEESLTRAQLNASTRRREERAVYRFPEVRPDTELGRSVPDETVIYEKGTRKSNAGTPIIMHLQGVDPRASAEERMRHDRILVRDVDGTLREASWEERVRTYRQYETSLKHDEMQPLDRVRQHMLTDVHYKGAPLRSKAFLKAMENAERRRQGLPIVDDSVTEETEGETDEGAGSEMQVEAEEAEEAEEADESAEKEEEDLFDPEVKKDEVKR